MRAGLERDVDRRAACARSPPPRVRRPRREGRPCARASPSPTISPPATTTAPTMGFGWVVPRPFSASSSARSRNRASTARILRVRPYAAPRAPSPRPRRHVEPRARMARRVAAARLRVRGAVVARARGADRHAPLARRSGGRARSQAERAVPHRSRHRGRRPRSTGADGERYCCTPAIVRAAPSSSSAAFRARSSGTPTPTRPTSSPGSSLDSRSRSPQRIRSRCSRPRPTGGPKTCRAGITAAGGPFERRCSMRRSTSTAPSTGRRPTSSTRISTAGTCSARRASHGW